MSTKRFKLLKTATNAVTRTYEAYTASEMKLSAKVSVVVPVEKGQKK
jgi:hypothetical protein